MRGLLSLSMLTLNPQSDFCVLAEKNRQWEMNFLYLISKTSTSSYHASLWEVLVFSEVPGSGNGRKGSRCLGRDMAASMPPAKPYLPSSLTSSRFHRQ